MASIASSVLKRPTNSDVANEAKVIDGEVVPEAVTDEAAEITLEATPEDDF